MGEKEKDEVDIEAEYTVEDFAKEVKISIKSAKKIWNLKTLKEEIEFIKNVKTEDLV